MENKKILIVEDDDFLLQMYVTKLELENFKVTGAINGVQGLKAAQRDKPDLMLLDLNLPEMDGFEVLERLKADDDTKDIPVLVLTNYAQKDNIDRCLELGAKDYLIKAHFVPSEVIKKIKDILSMEE
ncbi:response regulator [Candidatus Parcubacteria bacterium]|jgi:CheY-like chemotaxis protein|nr:response regulator [Candidatus Parcubacteria bacterium]